MLVSLSIRDVVLINRLDLTLKRGLHVLTGETGAGKTILLNALGLALGHRADAALLRPSAPQASVTAGFEVADDHPAMILLNEQGLAAEDGSIVLRRILGADGRSRAFVNDQAVSVGLLRNLGDTLVEVQGQFEQRGLLDPTSHRRLLDAYGGLDDDAGRVADLWRALCAAIEACDRAIREHERARGDEAYLRHAVAEIEALDPKPGEEQTLAQQRGLLRNAERLIEALNRALAELSGNHRTSGAESALASARSALERAADLAEGRFGPALEALGRAAAETEEALVQLRSLSADIDLDSSRSEQIEERYFALRELARKHVTEVDRLPALRDQLAGRLATIDGAGTELAELDRAVKVRRTAFISAAEALGAARRKAAKEMDREVNEELPALRLDKAKFRTRLDRLDEQGWGAQGMERVAFEVSTNPGNPPGPLAKIASGGELARFLLALKIVLAEVSPVKTLVFDEVDSGIGGAAAHAVGERLARLTRDRQVLVVTHSPQVGARGAHHWRVFKEPEGKGWATRVDPLTGDARREEIARMLSGAKVTDEARAAATRLMEAEV